MSKAESFQLPVSFYGAAGAIFVIATYYAKKLLTTPTRKRTMSFNSEVMVRGAFPDSAKVAAPIINIFFLFDKAPSIEKLKEASKTLCKYDRFRSATKCTNGRYDFVEVDVDFNKHVIQVDVDSEEDMQSKVDQINSEDLKGYGERPLWCIYRLSNKNGKGLSGVLIRVHHVIGDGISLVGTMVELFVTEKGEPYKLNIPVGGASGKSKKEVKSLSIISKIFSILVSTVEILTLGATAYDADFFFFMKKRSKMSMNASKCQTIVFPTLNLEFVKEIKNKADVSLNDVLLSATTGALRRFSEKLNDPVISKSNKKVPQLRALLPVAFPRAMEDMSKALRNKWAFLSLPLRFNIADCKERLYATNKITKERFSTPTVLVQFWIQSYVLPLLPKFLACQTAFDIFSRHTMVFSNVPGPAEPLLFCGQPLLGMQVIFPNLLNQVLLISYGGKIFFNMVVEEDTCPQGKELLPQLFLEEIKELAKEFEVDCSPSFMLASSSPQGQFGLVRSIQ
jgi:hypothetical protein